MPSSITLTKVNDLRLDDSQSPRRFRIPSYQRGYRWTAEEVTQLLEDVLEFKNRRYPQPDEFYCLQPIVLLPDPTSGLCEVVDGQQRLTTIWLILRHFNERLATRYQMLLYELSYDTRPGLEAFLDDPSEQKSGSNIDFYHIYRAVKAIEGWFDVRETEVEGIKDHLLNHTRVIWFELAESERPVAAFTRLNVGKIALTNGELIRGLFLRRARGSDSESTRLRIAYEWDLIEKSLQRSEFWHFLSNEPAPEGNRIDLVFKTLVEQTGEQMHDQPYAVFGAFSHRLSNPGTDIMAEWERIERTFLLLDEWFEDRTLFHLAGYLVCEKRRMSELLSLADGCTKSEFKQRLLHECRKALGIGDAVDSRQGIEKLVDSLSYGKMNNRARIRSLLLLFNLATMLSNKKSNLRFQFDSYKEKEGRWDIEHVRSVAQFPERERDQSAWLKPCVDYLLSHGDADDKELCSDINAWLDHNPKAKKPRPDFEPLYRRVRLRFKEPEVDDEETNKIGNLTLLDESTNRSYKNAVFALKRQRVLNLDRDGIFVPLCTRNVFLKCYNLKADSLSFWTQDDREHYRNAIVDMLNDFFLGGWMQ